MASNVLKVAMAFGGSMNYGNRQGIARFGMGMKTAALSMSAVQEVVVCVGSICGLKRGGCTGDGCSRDGSQSCELFDADHG